MQFSCYRLQFVVHLVCYCPAFLPHTPPGSILPAYWFTYRLSCGSAVTTPRGCRARTFAVTRFVLPAHTCRFGYATAVHRAVTRLVYAHAPLPALPRAQVVAVTRGCARFARLYIRIPFCTHTRHTHCGSGPYCLTHCLVLRFYTYYGFLHHCTTCVGCTRVVGLVTLPYARSLQLCSSYTTFITTHAFTTVHLADLRFLPVAYTAALRLVATHTQFTTCRLRTGSRCRGCTLLPVTHTYRFWLWLRFTFTLPVCRTGCRLRVLRYTSRTAVIHHALWFFYRHHTFTTHARGYRFTFTRGSGWLRYRVAVAVTFWLRSFAFTLGWFAVCLGLRFRCTVHVRTRRTVAVYCYALHTHFTRGYGCYRIYAVTRFWFLRLRFCTHTLHNSSLLPRVLTQFTVTRLVCWLVTAPLRLFITCGCGCTHHVYRYTRLRYISRYCGSHVGLHLVTALPFLRITGFCRLPVAVLTVTLPHCHVLPGCGSLRYAAHHVHTLPVCWFGYCYTHTHALYVTWFYTTYVTYTVLGLRDRIHVYFVRLHTRCYTLRLFGWLRSGWFWFGCHVTAAFWVGLNVWLRLCHTHTHARWLHTCYAYLRCLLRGYRFAHFGSRAPPRVPLRAHAPAVTFYAVTLFWILPHLLRLRLVGSRATGLLLPLRLGYYIVVRYTPCSLQLTLHYLDSTHGSAIRSTV